MFTKLMNAVRILRLPFMAILTPLMALSILLNQTCGNEEATFSYILSSNSLYKTPVSHWFYTWFISCSIRFKNTACILFSESELSRNGEKRLPMQKMDVALGSVLKEHTLIFFNRCKVNSILHSKWFWAVIPEKKQWMAHGLESLASIFIMIYLLTKVLLVSKCVKLSK